MNKRLDHNKLSMAIVRRST